MDLIPTTRDSVGVREVDAAQLDRSPLAVVNVGVAPDGLPWLCEVDRSGRIDELNRTLARLFDTDDVASLPPSLHRIVTTDLSRGLMGVHEIQPDGGAPVRAYVTRRPARALLGATLMSRMLDAPAETTTGTTSVSLGLASMELAAHTPASIERATSQVAAERHLVITVEGHTWTAAVGQGDRALRRPVAPWRRAVFESLGAFAGATATIEAARDRQTIPLADTGAYRAALARAGEHPVGGRVSFDVPSASVLNALIEAARFVQTLHDTDRIHGDLTPSNVLLDGANVTAPDGLSIPVGDVSTVVTFAWAAPEQIVSRPLDPRADVYAIGKMVCALVGAVPFGEKIDYVVPTGGRSTRTVGLLKTDGVFVDPAPLGVDRRWVAGWQALLSRLIAYDPVARPSCGGALADALSEQAEANPLPGTIRVEGAFGEILPRMVGGDSSLVRLLRDGPRATW